jgi:hypothetical protein
MHEIVTLQLGQRANYLATHFWNLQVVYTSVSRSSFLIHNRNLISHTMKAKRHPLTTMSIFDRESAQMVLKLTLHGQSSTI